MALQIFPWKKKNVKMSGIKMLYFNTIRIAILTFVWKCWSLLISGCGGMIRNWLASESCMGQSYALLALAVCIINY